MYLASFYSPPTIFSYYRFSFLRRSIQARKVRTRRCVSFTKRPTLPTAFGFIHFTLKEGVVRVSFGSPHFAFQLATFIPHCCCCCPDFFRELICDCSQTNTSAIGNVVAKYVIICPLARLDPTRPSCTDWIVYLLNNNHNNDHHHNSYI